MGQVIMALDQGTTSSRTILFDKKGDVLATASESLSCSYPHSGWVEQSPDEIWKTQKSTMFQALEKANLTATDITAIGITNQRETTIAWNTETGEPVHNAIVWQCRRTTQYCDDLKSSGYEDTVREKTGLVLDPYFSGTKMRWILKNIPTARRLAIQGKLAFGTIDSWLIWKLTNGEVHATDVSNASRTMLYNIKTLEWDRELLEKLQVPIETLPEVKPSCGIIAHTDPHLFGSEIPIAGVAGDQQAALFGQVCTKKGMAKNTYGTGCFLLMNTGDKPIQSKNGLISTIAWQIGDQVTYALEGSVFIAGALMQWMRDDLDFFEDVEETEKLATSIESSDGVYIVPAFVGLGAPYWDPHARGTIVGLTRGSTKSHLVRAGLESMAYQSYDMLKAMEKDAGVKLKILRVDGGASANNFLCQVQADLLGLRVSRPKIIETTAMGAAFLAGLATGVWPNIQAIENLWKEDAAFSLKEPQSKIDQQLKGWNRAVQCSRGWAE
ncbi:MAG: glycerol kinase [bacterium]|jgi:glycerol kinase